MGGTKIQKQNLEGNAQRHYVKLRMTSLTTKMVRTPCQMLLHQANYLKQVQFSCFIDCLLRQNLCLCTVTLSFFSFCNSRTGTHPIFLKRYHFMFHYTSSLVTLDVVILVLIILKTHVWLRDFQRELLHFESNIL